MWTVELEGALQSQDGFPRGFGSYALLSAFAHGGMGEVYLAKSGGIAGIDRLCVLKKLRPDLVQNEEYVRRFLDEARLVVQLNHANVANVFDVGKVGSEYYLAMEYVSGVSMKGLLTRAETEQQKLPEDVVVFMMAEALEGLDYAHRLEHPHTGQPLNLVHRDISPHNIMVSYEGDVKLIDFGLAASELKEEQTESQVVMGKVAYMAPEQARGERVNAACDQFAAGIVLYELLVGERFYGEMNNYQIWQVVGRGGHVPAKWTELDAELTPILGRALHPDPTARWPSCGELKDALMAWLVARYPKTSRRSVRAEVRSLFEDDTKKERNFLGQFADVDPAELRSDSGSGSLSSAGSVDNVHLITAGDDATMTATAFDSSSEPAAVGANDPTVRTDTGPTAANAVAALQKPEERRRKLSSVALGIVAVTVGLALGVFAVGKIRDTEEPKPEAKAQIQENQEAPPNDDVAPDAEAETKWRKAIQEILVLLDEKKRDEANSKLLALAATVEEGTMTKAQHESMEMLQDKMAKMDEEPAVADASAPETDGAAQAAAGAKPLAASTETTQASARERAKAARAARRAAAAKKAAERAAAKKAAAAAKASAAAASASSSAKAASTTVVDAYSAADLKLLKRFFETCGDRVPATKPLLTVIRNNPTRVSPRNAAVRTAIRDCKLALGSSAPPVP